MEKSFFNNAVIGNSSMLGCISDRGEMIRLYWPSIDYPQHVEKLIAGIFTIDEENSTVWLEEDRWKRSQGYIPDTNILRTIYTSGEKGLRVEQLDFVLPDESVLVREYQIESITDQHENLGFIVYSSAVSNTPNLVSTLFDFNNDALIHYRHGYYISISSNLQAYQFQLGNNAFDSAERAELNGVDSIAMINDGAVSWKLGRINGGRKLSINLFICASHTLKGLNVLTHAIKVPRREELLYETKMYWLNFVKNIRYIEELEKTHALKTLGISKTEIIKLYKRSVLLFRLMWNKNTGGLLASPEIDEYFNKCGRYGYCWGRDAAFITGALDKCGLTQAVDKFYQWAVNTQGEDGSWHQRYYMDGNLAPSWGIQIDETGTLIWGMLQHYYVVRDKGFLTFMWNSVYKAVKFLIEFIDKETGLPRPSYDLWEERVGEHAYSAAAVYGGISAGAEIGALLEKDKIVIEEWQKAADKLREAIVDNLWKENWKRFIRSVRTKLNPWGSEPSADTTMITANPKGYRREVTLEDWEFDVSIIGLTVPFEVFSVSDYRIKETVKYIEQVLTSPNVGGIKRYESDNYIGGNPWVLTTLWVAMYHIRSGNVTKAKNYLEWAVKARTPLYLLPEQVDRKTGKPAWVIPLTWSHAMFVHVLIELLEAGLEAGKV